MTPTPVVAAPVSTPDSDGRVEAGFLRQHRAAMSVAVLGVAVLGALTGRWWIGQPLFFVGLSVAFGIASVPAVVVVQRSREIGILRAMGLSRVQILRLFLLQGGCLR